MSFPVRRYLALLVTYLKPQWRRTLLMGALLLVNVGLQLLGPQVLRYFIDTILAGGATIALILAALIYVVITLADNGVSIATTYLSETVAWTALTSCAPILLPIASRWTWAFTKNIRRESCLSASMAM